MEFLDHTLTWDWCREHGFTLVEDEGPVAPRLAEDPSLTYREREVHSAAANAKVARSVATRVVSTLGPWDECLAWATAWDVWPNDEDWPRYYEWRARYGERRSVGEAPGHVFAVGDVDPLLEFLAHAIACGWDVTLLPARGGLPNGVRARISHDEWVEFLAARPIGFSAH